MCQDLFSARHNHRRHQQTATAQRYTAAMPTGRRFGALALALAAALASSPAAAVAVRAKPVRLPPAFVRHINPAVSDPRGYRYPRCGDIDLAGLRLGGRLVFTSQPELDACACSVLRAAPLEREPATRRVPRPAFLLSLPHSTCLPGQGHPWPRPAGGTRGAAPHPNP